MGKARPLFEWTDHEAAVKAIDWCPSKPSLLATGGGTLDRKLVLRDVSLGGVISSIDTGSQVKEDTHYAYNTNCAIRNSAHTRLPFHRLYILLLGVQYMLVSLSWRHGTDHIPRVHSKSISFVESGPFILQLCWGVYGRHPVATRKKVQ